MDFKKVRKFENLHIVFWLIKDSCWMLECKILGLLMIIPAISVAIYIIYLTKKRIDFYLNLAVLFWIIANSYWMCIEFYTDESLKIYTIFPFILGLICVSIYYYKVLVRNSKNINN